jgi:membrane associated rhomboid family serine protease
MFLPFDRKPDWRNPPYITLILILINSVIFVLYQSHDSEQFNDAYNFYIDSKLPELEIPQYIRYLNKNSHKKDASKIKEILYDKNTDHFNLQLIIFDMLADGGFKNALEKNEIIKPDNKNYIKWKLLRDQFSDKLNAIPGYRYALFASEPKYLDFITYQFLHADWAHLIGNMIFLFIFGFVLESALNRPVYLISYILAGVGSGLFYVYLDPNSAVASIGASGSISGLVGMYTVIFAFRKIRFFYYVLFYFNYVTAPAIILLPLWLIYELSLQWWGPENINNIAHIGGLLTGVIISIFIKYFTRLVNVNYINQIDDSKSYLSDYNKALNFVSKLEFDQATTILQKLHETNPNDIDVQFQLYNIAKHNPSSDLYHRQARNILSMANPNENNIKMLYTIYTEYSHTAKPPKLSANLLFTLATKFVDSPYITEAENIILFLLNKRPEFEKIPKGLALLVTNYKIQGNESKLNKYFDILKQQYPDSSEAKQTTI